MDLLDELQQCVLPGDGAMGTELMERGVPIERCFEELCVSRNELVRDVHAAYLAAGARIIRTNSFGSNAVRLARHGYEHRVNEINWSAAQLARDCAKRKSGVYVAGCVGPLGITSEEAGTQGIDRTKVFQEQMGALLDGGAQLICLETFLDLEELLIALEVKHSLHHCPVICSLACSAEGRLPDGTLVEVAWKKLRASGADIVGVNCVHGPQAMVRLFENLDDEGPLSAYPNAGYPEYLQGRFLYFTTPEYFANAARQLAGKRARLIGGCCGTGPQHIAAMTEALRAIGSASPTHRPLSANAREPAAPGLSGVGVSNGSGAVPPTLDDFPGEAETSIVDMVNRGRTVIVTELDPPKTLELDRFFTGAQALREAGSDAITLADNSLAILRVSNLAVGAMLKSRFGIMPLLHLSCRDRNVIGLQSELMGMAALGIRHVLPLTGDPARVGDHPGATSVYDVTSIELLRIVARLNAGLDASGRSIKRSAQLVPGCTFNPGAKNLDAQLHRLERKLAAGAQYVMTQPVFDLAVLDEMERRTRGFGVPIFPGVWPLLNGRQAEFLHNEVPGIFVPDRVRASMSGHDGEAGRSKGIEIARAVCRGVIDRFPGVYLITPFLHYETTVELASYVRSQSTAT